ncbi:type II toxin-antitoxin system RelE/ParE family toxin [Methylorubrum populi]|uniref:type II toxin-antitoxin system RelE/ParE family toxin n=1 Tax=Methylorubrum populi TaxID=223967 RepID=UPI00059C815A
MVVKYDNVVRIARRTRPISWIKAARKAFETFPRDAQDECLRALTIAAEGERADIVKPLQGLGSGIWEVVLRHRNDAFRVVYAVQIDADLWVVHAFQKKSISGIKTPQHEIDVVRERLKRLKEALA